MAIEVDCTGCKKRLRVGDEHAGQRARCPECQTVFTVPERGAGEEDSGQVSESTAEQTPLNWRLQTPEGQIYGPVSKSELDTWVAEGRVSGGCLVRERDDEDWHSAADVYPILLAIPSQPALPPSSNPFSDEGNRNAECTSKAPEDLVRPHRGGMILALGIIGWFTSCFVLGLVACVMGQHDLQSMKAGRMDREGRKLTQIGTIFGLIQCILFALGLAIMIVSLLLRAFAAVGTPL